jgi:putative sigma-54 modulation protein
MLGRAWARPRHALAALRAQFWRPRRRGLAGAAYASLPGDEDTWRPPHVQLNISTRHGHLSEATQAKIRSKTEKISRLFERLTAIEVIVDLKDSQRPEVDVKVSAEHKHDFVAHEQGDSLWAALDAAVQKVEGQLRKYKTKVQERHRDPDARRAEAPADVEGED